jgi:adenylate kinase family enzyme
VDLTRTLVLGCSGSGKSTLATALTRRTGLPLVHLDQEYWAPGWVERYSPAGWADRVEQLAGGPRWIIDGNYSATLHLRLARATAILWLDLPRWVCLGSILWRLAACYGRTRPDMAEGCCEGWDPQFLRFAWTWHRLRRPRTQRLVERPEFASRLCVFRTRQAAWRWMNGGPTIRLTES